MRQLAWLSLIALVWGQAVLADSWDYDAWHIVEDDSPFFASERAEQHAAAVLQRNGRFALLVLGTPEQGALVSVNLPGSKASDRLLSVLVFADRTSLTRDVSGEQLYAETTSDGVSVTYSFRIAPGDLERFMAAESWTVRNDTVKVTLTLNGSRKAISAALEARARSATLVSASE